MKMPEDVSGKQGFGVWAKDSGTACGDSGVSLGQLNN